MPTLSAVFRLFDGYSTQLNRFVDKVNRAAEETLKASKNTDSYNDSLENMGQTAGIADRSLGKLLGTVGVIASMKKTMDWTDTYINTSARLELINDELQAQLSLQDKIFLAADRARGCYNDMADAVAKMRLLAGDSFANNDEVIAFTELLQKSLKVSGAGTTEQQSAFLQLTQAMAAGKLQGDEFRSIMENAPMVAQAISDYMGVSKGELKELSSEGLITADIIKNAMFNAAEDIDDKFSQMPMTFADMWTKIGNAGKRAFGGVFQKLNNLLNSDAVQGAIDNFVGAIYLAGKTTEWFIDLCIEAWPMVSPFIWAAVAALGAYASVQLLSNGLSLLSAIRTGAQAVSIGILALAMWATSKATWEEVTAQLALDSALYACPLVWIIGLVLVLAAAFYAGVAAVNHFAGTSYSATGLICGAFATAGAFILNMLISGVNTTIGCIVDVHNFFAGFANAIATMFNNPVAGIIMLFANLFDFIVGFAQQAAQVIDTVFGSKLADSIIDLRDNFAGKIDEIVGEDKVTVMEKWDASDYQLDRINFGDAWNAGYGFGEGVEGKVSGLFSGFNDLDSMAFDQNWSDFATGGNPAVVEGTGQGGTMQVDMADEDIQYLRDLAQREYVAKIANNTLAPNIRVEFTGPVTKEADVDKVAARLGEILKDEIASTAEEVY